MVNLFYKGTKAIQCRKESLSTNGAGTFRHSCAAKRTSIYNLHSTETLNYITQMYHRFKCKTIKLLGKKIEENLCDLGLDTVFRYNTKSTIHQKKMLVN